MSQSLDVQGSPHSGQGSRARAQGARDLHVSCREGRNEVADVVLDVATCGSAGTRCRIEK